MLTSVDSLIKWLKGISWSVIIRMATLKPVNSTFEYCARVSCRNAHVQLIDTTINEALHL